MVVLRCSPGDSAGRVRFRGRWRYEQPVGSAGQDPQARMIPTAGTSRKDAPDASSTGPMRYDSPRSAPRRRRRWLRELDSPLGREFEDAGALSCAELVELSAEPLRRCASPQTVEEWWQYAYRRGWLEDHGYECRRLTAFGRAELRDRRERDAWPEPGSPFSRGLVVHSICGSAGCERLVTAAQLRYEPHCCRGPEPRHPLADVPT
jgi:hypothetical protein